MGFGKDLAHPGLGEGGQGSAEALTGVSRAFLAVMEHHTPTARSGRWETAERERKKNTTEQEQRSESRVSLLLIQMLTKCSVLS